MTASSIRPRATRCASGTWESWPTWANLARLTQPPSCASVFRTMVGSSPGVRIILSHSLSRTCPGSRWAWRRLTTTVFSAWLLMATHCSLVGLLFISQKYYVHNMYDFDSKQEFVFTTGSRDMCIKRWDLSRMELVQSLNNAHKDWILGLCLINSGSVMISGCRGGILRAWTVPNFGDHAGECALLGEVRAHTSAINATVTNQQHIFTASKWVSFTVWIFYFWSSLLFAPGCTRTEELGTLFPFYSLFFFLLIQVSGLAERFNTHFTLSLSRGWERGGYFTDLMWKLTVYFTLEIIVIKHKTQCQHFFTLHFNLILIRVNFENCNIVIVTRWFRLGKIDFR